MEPGYIPSTRVESGTSRFGRIPPLGRMVQFAASVCLFVSVGTAAEPKVDFSREVRPILAQHCYHCHGSTRAEGGLRLDSIAAIRKGSADQAVVVVHDAKNSPLYQRLTATDETRMPPPKEGAALPAADIDLLRRWIDAGAAGGADESATGDPRGFWSYQPPRRPEVPSVPSSGTLNPVDAFIAAEQARVGVTPLGEAPPRILLRRLYLDLIGLPPTEEVLARFEQNPSESAYAEIVDQLLARPEYGQRWARHWMDIWRYSDWYGFREMKIHYGSRRHIWHWRDWIVESINADRGYDRMVQDMLAADELYPGDEKSQRANGYLERNFYAFSRDVWLQDTIEHLGLGMMAATLRCARCHDHKYEPISQEEYFRLRAFFEPMQVRTDRVRGHRDEMEDLEPVHKKPRMVLRDGFDRVYDDGEPPTYLYRGGNEKDPIKDRVLPPGVPAILGTKVPPVAIQPVSLPRDQYFPMLRDFVVEEEFSAAQQRVASDERQLDQARAEWRRAASYSALVKSDAAAPKKLEQAEVRLQAAEMRLVASLAGQTAVRATVAADRSRFASGALGPPADDLAKAAALAQHEARLADWRLKQFLANAEKAGAMPNSVPAPELPGVKAPTFDERIQEATDAIAKLVGTSPGTAYEPLGTIYPTKSSGRRTALARWMTHPRHPRTSRVAVNHVWLRHFGKPIVPNVSDFGVNQPGPTHPQLLDWLAIDFADHGWSMKRLHRQLVTSRAYRTRSEPSPEEQKIAAQNEKLDRDNVYLWRWNSRRMEGEVLRDSLLALAGRLSSESGGPDRDPDLAESLPLRSVYFRHTSYDRPAMLELFDSPSADECYRRPQTIVPQQAWGLLCSKMAVTTARQLANQVVSSPLEASASDADQVRAVYRHLLCRDPVPAEMDRCLAFLREETSAVPSDQVAANVPAGALQKGPASSAARVRAYTELVHVLLNHHDFITIH